MIYSVIIGNIDLVNVVCNFGADAHIKDNDDMDALDYARKFGQYKITELLYYRQLSGSLGSDMKHIAQQIHSMDKQAQLMMQFEWKEGYAKHKLYPGVIQYMIQAMKERATFGQGTDIHVRNICVYSVIHNSMYFT